MKQSGMSLVEVMVAVVILGSGLLGLGALQARSVVVNQSAFYRSIAADLAADLADRIRANRSPFLGRGTTGVPSNFPQPPDFSKCPQNTSSPDTAPTCASQVSTRNAYRVATEMSEWNSALRAQLVNATYNLVSADAGNGFLRYTLTITWLDDRQSTSSSNNSYTTVIE